MANHLLQCCDSAYGAVGKDCVNKPRDREVLHDHVKPHYQGHHIMEQE